MSEWRDVSLGDLCRIQSGFAFKSRDWTDFGIPVVKIQNVRGGRVNLEGCSFVSPEIAATATRYRLGRGDVLVTMSGEIGSVGIVRSDEEVLLNQRVGRVLLNEDDPTLLRFVGYALQHPDLKARMELSAFGAAQPNISPKLLATMPIRLPCSSGRRRITAILGAIDDLIENNRRRVEVLEEMAKAIYREWFVHFRYPGHEDATFVDSPLGPIPDSWNATELGRVATVNGATRKPENAEVVRYLDISCLGDRIIETPSTLIGAEAPGRARRVVAAGDVVWSMVRPNRRAHALLVNPGKDWIASTGLAVLSPVDVSTAFLFESVSTTEFSDYLVSQEGGAAYPAVKPRDFERAPFLRPAADMEVLFAQVVAPIHQLTWTLRAESERLASIRDLLLPKLVTGQIDVSSLDPDAAVEASVA